jgi:hypothetical protein
MFRSSTLLPLLALVIFGAAAPAHANLKVFLGKYGGKYTGVLVEASGKTGRAIADAATRVQATAGSAKFLIKGTLNGTGYRQIITLKGGKATISSLIPGGSGPLQASATGTYTAGGKTARLTFVNPGGLMGRMTVTISFVTGGSTLMISTVITQSGGSDPIYATVIGA